MTSLKYIFTPLVAAGLSIVLPMSWNADRNLPIIESTVLKAARRGHAHPTGGGRLGHVGVCTTVFPVASVLIKKLTTSSDTQDSGVGRPGRLPRNFLNLDHAAHLCCW